MLGSLHSCLRGPPTGLASGQSSEHWSLPDARPWAGLKETGWLYPLAHPSGSPGPSGWIAACSVRPRPLPGLGSEPRMAHWLSRASSRDARFGPLEPGRSTPERGWGLSTRRLGASQASAPGAVYWSPPERQRLVGWAAKQATPWAEGLGVGGEGERRRLHRTARASGAHHCWSFSRP